MDELNSMGLLDLAPARETMYEDVIEGLTRTQKRLSSKYFYDQRGSELFDAICELPEYYPTRTELSILRDYLSKMVRCIGTNSCVIEIGSGSSVKTAMLLASVVNPRAYVPIDISREHLMASADAIALRHPGLEVRPICADFLQPLVLPSDLPECDNHVIYFPGSTLGNLTEVQAAKLLSDLSQLTRRTIGSSGSRGGLLLGIDLIKDPRVLEAAYNDSQGVTADFNLNILRHINHRLNCHIPVDAYQHHAPYNSDQHRIEMHLVARRNVHFSVGDHEFEMEKGESILTEYSHKYDVSAINKLLSQTGWQLRDYWTDSKEYFAVIYCDLI